MQTASGESSSSPESFLDEELCGAERSTKSLASAAERIGLGFFCLTNSGNTACKWQIHALDFEFRLFPGQAICHAVPFLVGFPIAVIKY